MPRSPHQTTHPPGAGSPTWPSDDEVDAATALLSPGQREFLQELPLLMLDHLGRAVPSTPEGKHREAFRAWLGPLDHHTASVAWDANGGPLADIAAVMWRFYDELAAANAEEPCRRDPARSDAVPAAKPGPASFDIDDDRIARLVLREREAANNPREYRDYFWGWAGLEAHRLRPEKTKLSTRQKRLARALKRVAGIVDNPE